VLVKYTNDMTSRPGKCKLFRYKFRAEADRPVSGYSRPIPFALRPATRSLITDEMLKYDILEVGNLPVLSPLIVVRRDGKKPSICVDTHKVNQYTIPDYERTPPLQVPGGQGTGPPLPIRRP
jgi:hypothetical protein